MEVKPEVAICGAGHGGLVAGAILARNGFHVTLYEKKARNQMGFDWTDNIPLEIFERLGITRPQPHEYFRSSNYQFISPLTYSKLMLEQPEENREIAMERTVIYTKLIQFALDAGVKINFETSILGPIVNNGIITGIQLKDRRVTADLIIDAAGFHTPIRPQLPSSYNIRKSLERGERFYTYRAFYKLNADQPHDPDPFQIYFAFQGMKGIAWFRIVRDYCDILFGKIDPFSEGEIDQLLIQMQKIHPELSSDRIRGGTVEIIPVRHPLELLVGPNYALVGDSACMPIPLNGSGIANAMRAGKMLAETIIQTKKMPSAQPEVKFPMEVLWTYQVCFFRELGANLTQTNYVKYYLLGLPPKEMEYIFTHQLIKPIDIENSLRGRENNMSIMDLLQRLIRGFPRIDILLNLKSMVDTTKDIVKDVLQIPATYEKAQVSAWIQRIQHYFKEFEHIFQNK